MKINHIAQTSIYLISVIVFIAIAGTNMSKKIWNSEKTEPTTQEFTTEYVELETETFIEEVVISEEYQTTKVEQETETEPQPKLVSLGVFTITAYCSCEKCCGEWANDRPAGVVYGASGEELIADYSIAVDLDLIPYGETIIINGQEYVAHDCGGAIQGNRIDIYMSSHEKAIEWGIQNIEIFKELK